MGKTMDSALDAGMSRRSFLTGAVAAGAGIAAAGSLAATTKQAFADEAEAEEAAEEEVADEEEVASDEEVDWLGSAPDITDDDCAETVDCEVLVIGAGCSGYFAAAAAAENGAQVLLIEKNAAGNSIRSSALGAVNSTAQKEQNITIDEMEIVNDYDHYALGQCNSRLWRKWAQNSGEAIDWYTDLLAENGMEVQLEWNVSHDTVYKCWPTGHGTNGDDFTGREADVAEIMDAYITSFDGCEERFSTPMQCLIEEDGRVVGAYAQDADGNYIRINASKGVIVATGGYSYNPDMYAALQPTRYSCLGSFLSYTSTTGDGIKALLWLGAQLDDVHTSLTFNRSLLLADQQPGDPYNSGGNYFTFSSQPFLRVDCKGERFHNESAPYDFVLNAIAKRPEGERYWHQVWDSNWKEDVTRFHTIGCSTLVYREGSDHDAYEGKLDDEVEPQIEELVEAGYIVKADTLEELAEALGFDEEATENFLATCERQNENFDNQIDPDFGKEPFRLSELRTAPFYATVKSCGLTLCTLDGIVVNDDLQPLGADGEPIEGVYVVGNDQGCMYAGTYTNLGAGTNAGRSATFGRMVGKALAEA